MPWVLAVGAIDLGLEQFIVVPILPAVQQEFGAPLSTTTWLLTGFLLAAVAVTPISGRLGDMYGRRRLLLVSVGAFALGSLVCALAESASLLIAGRVVQGIGAAAGPLAIGIARDQAPEGRAPVWVGLLLAAAGAGAALGMLVGGFLVDSVSVGAVFWFLFALAVALMLGIWRLIPESPTRNAGRPDLVGAALLACALLAALLGITQANAWGWSSGRVIGLFVLSAFLVAAFLLMERSRPDPLVDMRLFVLRPVWSANVVAFAMGFALFIASVVIPLIAALPKGSTYGFGLTYTEIGLLLTPGALAIVLGGWASGALVGTLGARPVIASGAAIAAGAYGLFVYDATSIAWVASVYAVLGLGIGLAVAAITNLVIHGVDREHTSVFAATTAVNRSIGAALGAQIAAAIVVAAGVTGSGFPKPDGLTGAFVLGLSAALVALCATALTPSRATDPIRNDGRWSRDVELGEIGTRERDGPRVVSPSSPRRAPPT